MKSNNFVSLNKDEFCYPGKISFYVDRKEKTYRNLYETIKTFLQTISYLNIDNPSKIAEYILNYLYVVYYRAIVKTNHDCYEKDFCSSGMSVDDSYAYLFGNNRTGNGLIYCFYYFCVKKQLASLFMKAQKTNNTFGYLLA